MGETAKRTQSKLTTSELERHVLAAARTPRRKVDQADFKSYIFPLLFFMRLSDVYNRALEGAGGDHDLASIGENHRFTMPEALRVAGQGQRSSLRDGTAGT